MIPPQSIRTGNQILRDLDAIFPGNNSFAKFQWRWSSDLWSLVPALDDNGDQKFEFICNCGADMKVHSITCTGITEARIKMEKVYMVDTYGPLESYPNMWVLCRWVSPPSREEWANSMGTTQDYPETGRYLPVSKDSGMGHVIIPPRATNDEHVSISRMVVNKLRENYEKYLLAEANKDTNTKREVPVMDKRGNMIIPPHKDAKFWGIRDRIKDSMLKFDPSSTTGYGGKTALGHQPKRRVHQSDRSLADPTGPLARELKRPVEELARELLKQKGL